MIARPPAGGARPAGGPPGGGFGRMFGLTGPPQKVKDFRGTIRRLLWRLQPEWGWILFAILLTAAGVALTVLGPKILANATNLLFDGLVGKSLPSNLTKAQVIALLRARGQNQLADMLGGMDVTPGHGVDFAAIASVLMLAVLVYVGGALLVWMQGYIMACVTQRTVFRMRRDVEEKLHRLPLSYFDEHERGDLLSRVTNDIDNLGTTLNQTLGQLLNSVLTVIGVLAIMLTINVLLAVISLVVVPVSAAITVVIARRSQRRFVEQWRWTGRLSGHVEQMHTGHALVQVFGYRPRALPGRQLPLPARPATDRRLRPRRAARSNDCHRGSHRRRQDDHREPADALLRRRWRRYPHRRRRHPRPAPRRAPAQVRDGP